MRASLLLTVAAAGLVAALVGFVGVAQTRVVAGKPVRCTTPRWYPETT
jgi:hypothetical protein